MKKLSSLLVCTFVACLTLVLFSSCEEESGLAPKSLTGKTFSYSEWPFRKVHFTSESSLVFEDDPNGEQAQPISYAYKKKSPDTGELTIRWASGSLYTNAGEEYSPFIVTLTFTTPETGWFITSTGKHGFTLK